MMCEPLTDEELQQKLEEFLTQKNGPEVELFEVVKERLGRARRIHPKVGENIFHGLSAFEAEVGEAVQEVVKQRPGWEERMDDELIDTIVVAVRLILREYEHDEQMLS